MLVPQNTENEQSAPPYKSRFFNKKILLFLIITTSGSLFLVGLVAGYFVRPRIIDQFSKHGFIGERVERQHLVKAAKTVLPRLLKARRAQKSFPLLQLDIKFKNWEKLRKKRKEALQIGEILKSDDDYVPARVQFAGQNLKAKIRLKGDIVDHLESDRWSFRIKLSNDGRVMGMRKFSIQHPLTRNYLNEALFHRHLRHEGVLAPRYDFVDVRINGKHVGLMAIEEHFSKEILESQSRKEGVILSFDETKHWENQMWTTGMISPNYPPVTPFMVKSVKKSDVLKKQWQLGTELLRGFVEGKLSTSQVFDTKTLSRFIAISEIWGAVHGLYWTNLRFYLNPYLGKLEPIGFDAIPSKKPVSPYLLNSLFKYDTMLSPLFFEDPVFVQDFIQALQKTTKDIETDSFLKDFQDFDHLYKVALWRDFPLLESFDFHSLKKRASQLKLITSSNIRNLTSSQGLQRSLINAHYLPSSSGTTLEITNLTPHPIKITEIKFINGDRERHALKKNHSPHRIPPPEVFGFPSRLSLPIPTVSADEKIIVTASIDNTDSKTPQKTYQETATPYFHPRKTEALQSWNIQSITNKYPFFQWNKKKKNFRIASGRYKISDLIILPEGISLEVAKGAHLTFSKKAGIICKAAMNLHGEKTAPITFTGINGGTWQGLAIIRSPQKSTWNWVRVLNTSGLTNNLWGLTAGVSVFESEIAINSSVFQGNQTEDALNIVRSRFQLNHVDIFDTLSDAFDSDFSQGSVFGGYYKNIGGDGIDVSGTSINVNQTRFFNVHDKAVSVGEKSQLNGIALKVEESGTGLASKDGSQATLKQSKLIKIKHVALMSYIKKKEYGPASIVATNVVITDSKKQSLAQTLSKISLNGTEVPSQEVDVEAFYKGYMKK